MIPLEVGKTPKVAIVILNFNGGSLSADCVRDFREKLGGKALIVVVDNGSSDGSDRECARISGVTFIQTEKNLGYTGGNNVGIRHALRAGVDYVLVVNNDVKIVNKNFLSEMVEFMEANPRVAIAGPKVFFRKLDAVQNTLCSMPFLKRKLISWPMEKLGFRKQLLSGDTALTPEVLNGVCILLRRKFLDQVGLMDEFIFMYLDDTDLAIRARKFKWELAYLPIPSIVHLQKEKGYDYFGMVDFLLKRNTVYVLSRHGKKLDAVGFAASAVVLSGLRAIGLTIRSKPSRHAWRFVALLWHACLAALRLKVDTSAFGPPGKSWSEMIGRC